MRTSWALLTAKLLLSAVAIFTALNGTIADWSVTHIFDERWPAPAKFHNGQTMAMGKFLPAESDQKS